MKNTPLAKVPEAPPNLSVATALGALKLDPHDFAGHRRIAVVYLYWRQFGKAITEHEKARDCGPFYYCQTMTVTA